MPLSLVGWAWDIYISGPSGEPAIKLTVSHSMAAEAAVVHGRRLLSFLLLAVASGSYDGARQPSINRRSFPHGFVFGTASSAYQVLPSCSVHRNQNGVMVWCWVWFFAWSCELGGHTCSMRVQRWKEAEDQASGTHSLTNTQACTSRSTALHASHTDNYWDRPLFLIWVLWWSHGHHCDLRKMLVLSTQVGVDNSPFTPSQKSSSH